MSKSDGNNVYKGHKSQGFKLRLNFGVGSCCPKREEIGTID